MINYIILLGIISTVFGQSTTVQTCNNNAPLPINVDIEGCTQPPCGFPQLSRAKMNIVFQSPRLIQKFQARVWAYLGGILPIYYPLGDQADGCRGLTNSRCPLLAGEVLRYTLNFDIEPFMPVGTAVTLEFILADEDTNSNIMCMRLPIRIDPPLVE